MGGTTFETRSRVSKKTSDDEAFENALSFARHDSGHGGYTGTLAEKNSFIMIHRARSAQSAERIVHALMSDEPIPIYRDEIRRIIDDKGGPAGAVRYPIDKEFDGIIFFGWASC